MPFPDGPDSSSYTTAFYHLHCEWRIAWRWKTEIVLSGPVKVRCWVLISSTEKPGVRNLLYVIHGFGMGNAIIGTFGMVPEHFHWSFKRLRMEGGKRYLFNLHVWLLGEELCVLTGRKNRCIIILTKLEMYKSLLCFVHMISCLTILKTLLFLRNAVKSGRSISRSTCLDLQWRLSSWCGWDAKIFNPWVMGSCVWDPTPNPSSAGTAPGWLLWCHV